ncbi:putative Structural maintenance of chromosomes protein 6 [Glarea lozoyensis 74030]|nr:putative Structural maintenance of chromosomes protein 6 [Glarea lozoyensis 74030]
MEITCYNFMCHTRLHVEFGPLINFVVGMNGSGKSAVLTAVTLCLGGKAASTNRGASMKTLIKTGEDQAVLKVRLKNKGNDAYQPDVFGPSIIVERHFTRSGTGGYKLKNDIGKTISTKKSDVDDMIEYYQLMVDNPMNVLTQDAAKSFITSSTPAQKYKFFVEGVQLEALDNDYKLVADTMDQIASKLRDSEDDLAAHEKDRDDAKKRADMIEERSGLRAAAKLLQCQCAWSQVEEVELSLRKKEEELEAAKEVIKMQEKRAEEEARKYEEANNTLERWKQVQTQLEVDAAPVQEEYENAKNLQKDIQTELLKLKGERDNVKQNVKTFENKVKSYKNDLRAEMQRLEDLNGGAQARKLEEMDQAKITVAEAIADMERHKTEGPQLEEARKIGSLELKKAEELLNRKREEIHNVNQEIRTLGEKQVDPIAGFDRKMPQLIRAINSERRFQEKPIGPIGMHIKLLNPIWSYTIESMLGAVLAGFIVTSKADQQILAELKRRLGMEFVPVLIGNHSRIDISRSEPEHNIDTVLRVLEIDNELVRNQLIIGNAIEQSVLFERRQEGYDYMYDPRGKPRNVRQCFTLHDTRRDAGHRLSWIGGGRNQDISGVKYRLTQRPRMRTDVDKQIEHQQGILVQLQKESRDLENARSQAQRSLRESEVGIMNHKRNFKVLKDKIQRAEARVEDLENELEQDNGAENKVQGLEADLKEAEGDLKMYGETLGNVMLAIEESNKISHTRKREVDALKLRVEENEHKLRKAMDKVRNSSQIRELSLRDKNAHIELIEEAKSGALRAEKKRDMAVEQVEQYVEQASVVSLRVNVPENKKPADLDAEFQALKSQIKEFERKQGGTDKEINDRYVAANKKFQEAKSTRAELEDLLEVLRHSFAKRLDMFRRFQQHISARSRINFQYLLSERAFRGILNIDHKSKQLDVHVEPDNTTKSGKGRKTKTLSGGEKSFSSICLLLALWEAMGAPLRCLDEYDVFMDDVNRDVSTKMIISAARRSVGRQFILITPKALGSGAGDDADDVKVIKLKDPRNPQQQIDDMMRAH